MSTSAGKVLLTPKGEYNGATTYSVLDWVLYQGKPYVAKQTTTGNVPTNTTYWQLLVDNPTTDMVGATSSSAGVHGLVPAPSAGDEKKVLRGDATWGDLPKAVIQQIPTQAVALDYNGSSQSPSWLYYNPNILTIGGQTSGTNAGDYVATFTPKNGFCWDDLTANPKNVIWSISQAEGHATIPITSLSLDATNPDTAFMVMYETGTLSIRSSNTNVATAVLGGVDGHKAIVEAVNDGNCTIYIDVAASADGNYSSHTYEIAVSVDLTPVLVPWDTATDAQIKAIINGYYADRVTLSDIQSVWSVGDTRTMTISAMSATGVSESHRQQDVEMVILDFLHDDLTTPINGKTKALLSLQTKDCLMDADCEAGTKYGMNNTENGKMHESSSSINYQDCARRTWLNSVFYNALPEYFKALVKQVGKKTTNGSYGTGGSIITVNDYCWLPSVKEVANYDYSTLSGQGTHYPYYDNSIASRRYKMPHWESRITTYGKSSYWWTRSLYGPSASVYGVINGEGDIDGYYSTNGAGIAPACCL